MTLPHETKDGPQGESKDQPVETKPEDQEVATSPDAGEQAGDGEKQE